MPSERDMERWIERGLEAIHGLTQQVSRMAYALEICALDSFASFHVAGKVAEGEPPGSVEIADPCPTCRSRLVIVEDMECEACGSALPSKEKTDA